MPHRRAAAFAPGRVNLIGEHTDYNDGLSLPFAIDRGVTVSAAATGGDEFEAHALDHGEHDRFRAAREAGGWRAFVRGTVATLEAAGYDLPGARIEIAGDLPEGGGLASSAALTIALALALLALARANPPERFALAELCSRVEREWLGAHTGLLDQLAALAGARDHAVRIDFHARTLEQVPLRLGRWRLAAVDSGERRALGDSAYNERRAECERARSMLEVATLRDARDPGRLPEPLDRRVRHAIEESERVDLTVAALRAGDLATVGTLLDESHLSLRDLYDASTPAVERARDRLLSAGAAGARMIGGGFGGHVLALFPPGAPLPAGALPVAPSAGARLLA
jgi:galactokinase